MNSLLIPGIINTVLTATTIVVLLPNVSRALTKVTPANYRDLGFKVDIHLGREAVFYTVSAKTAAFGIIENDYAKLLLGRDGARGGCRVAGESTKSGAKWEFGVPLECVNDAQFVYQDSYLALYEFMKAENLLRMSVDTYLQPSKRLKVVLAVTSPVGLGLSFASTCHFACSIKKKNGKQIAIDPETCGDMLTSLYIPAGETRKTEFLLPRFDEPLEPWDYVVSFGVCDPHNRRFLPWRSVTVTIPETD
jgi:hypothetical protein